MNCRRIHSKILRQVPVQSFGLSDFVWVREINIIYVASSIVSRNSPPSSDSSSLLYRHSRSAQGATWSPPHRAQPRVSRIHQERAVPRISPLPPYVCLIPKLGLQLHHANQVVCDLACSMWVRASSNLPPPRNHLRQGKMDRKQLTIPVERGCDPECTLKW